MNVQAVTEIALKFAPTPLEATTALVQMVTC